MSSIKIIRGVVFFSVSFIMFIGSQLYIHNGMSSEGEYNASLHKLYDHTIFYRISSKIIGNEFITHTYLTCPSIDGVASFQSKGSFVKSNKSGDTLVEYIMQHDGRNDIIDIEEANDYIGLVNRVGMLNRDEIKVIYYSRLFNVVYRHRDNDFVMFSKRK